MNVNAIVFSILLIVIAGVLNDSFAVPTKYLPIIQKDKIWYIFSWCALLIKQTLENLNGKIHGLLHIEVGFDYNNKETAGEIVLYSEFDSKKALANYYNHPEHVVAKTIVEPRTCDRRVVDYVI